MPLGQYLSERARPVLREARYARERSQILQSRSTKLHLGCGPEVLPGWINVAGVHHPGAAVMRLPSGLRRFADNSMSFVYCSHMVEHIDYPDQVHKLATEIRRILKPGGALRFVVPGIERIIRAYAANDETFFIEKQAPQHPPSCTTKMEHL